MSIPLLWVALLALLAIGAGFAVSATRAKAATIVGSSTDPEDSLYKIIRAYGNSVDYVPNSHCSFIFYASSHKRFLNTCVTGLGEIGHCCQLYKLTANAKSRHRLRFSYCIALGVVHANVA